LAFSAQRIFASTLLFPWLELISSHKTLFLSFFFFFFEFVAQDEAQEASKEIKVRSHDKGEVVCLCGEEVNERNLGHAASPTPLQ